ncbi:lipid-binding protein [Pedobacter foliorum]|uniref:lipid-binding protein n=1 Tax=Pedobacter foliorum TaxID=2739058 RepID=UPI0015634482|nr:lipid-binding protein [Pedobacter foliorum]NRF38523.1 hypothetical protein [Pedobacter foliorum]
MKSNRLIYSVLVLVGLTAASCKKDHPEVVVSPVYPISGEWYVHVYNEDGSAARPTYATLSTYNTSDNVNNIVWMKMLTSAVPYGLLGKVACNVPAKTISGDGTNIAFTPNKGFKVLEGKVLLDATKLKGSKTIADSIYVKYSTETDGKTYILSGHRRSQFVEDQY